MLVAVDVSTSDKPSKFGGVYVKAEVPSYVSAGDPAAFVVTVISSRKDPLTFSHRLDVEFKLIFVHRLEL